MKEKQINKLYDLYGMTNKEASAQWKCSSYVGVLQHKINREIGRASCRERV